MVIIPVEDMFRNAAVGQQTNLILLVFSKAFVKVSREKLLFKYIENLTTKN